MKVLVNSAEYLKSLLKEILRLLKHLSLEARSRFHLLSKLGFWFTLALGAGISMLLLAIGPKTIAENPFEYLCYLCTVLSMLGFTLVYACSNYALISLFTGPRRQEFMALPPTLVGALLSPLLFTLVLFWIGLQFLLADQVMRFLLVVLGYGLLFLVWDFFLLAAACRLMANEPKKHVGETYQELAFDYLFRVDLPSIVSTFLVVGVLYAIQSGKLISPSSSEIEVMGDHLVPLGATLVQLVLIGFIVLTDTGEAVEQQNEEEGSRGSNNSPAAKTAEDPGPGLTV